MFFTNRIFLTWVIFAFLNKFVGAQESQGYYLYSEGFALSWSYYQGKIDTNSTYAAGSIFVLGHDIYKNDTLFILKSAALFDPENSWVLYRTKDGLEHEFYHFKLTEISRRMLVKELVQFDLKKYPIDMSWWIEDRFKNYALLLNEQQVLYDEESNHGQDRLEQLKWESKIDSWLADLNDFKGRYIIFYFDNQERFRTRYITDSLSPELDRFCNEVDSIEK